MKTKLISIAATVAALSIALTGCASAKFGDNESPSVVVKFDSKVKYFATINGNVNKFFDNGTPKTVEALANNQANIALSDNSGSKRYHVMIKPSIITQYTVILDKDKAKSKNCPFPVAVASSYWDMDMDMILSQFKNAPKGTIFATNSTATEAYMFSPNKDKKSGQYLAASLSSKKQLTKVQYGVFSGIIDVDSDKLPKLTASTSEEFKGSNLQELPVKLTNKQWITIVNKIKTLPPRGDEINFYGLTDKGEIVKATYKNKTCKTL